MEQGRTYYLQVSSAEECNRVVEELRRLAKTARKESEAKTRFRRSQDRMRRVLESSVFQKFSAFIIFAVRTPRTPQRIDRRKMLCCESAFHRSLQML